MTLRTVLEEMEVVAVRGDAGVEISGLAYDSRRVRRGDLFFALSGVHADGRAFVREALDAGAAAAVVAAGSDVEGAAATLIEVEEPRRALAQAALRYWDHPSRELAVVGVTGTNGKTTTTYLVHAILTHAAVPAALAGTTGVRFGGEHRPSSFTTPEAPELQSLLREMVRRGVRAAAFELSSHALVQRRCFGIDPDVAVFTNLSHDHLDYHGTLENYLDAKLMLFDRRNDPASAKRATAVINADDPAFPAVRDAARAGRLAITTYGAAAGADVVIESVTPRASGLGFTLREGDRAREVTLPLLGRYNAWNAAAAYGAARALGIAADIAAAGLAGAAGVPGRLERVEAGQPFAVVVDYAHTPDALARALEAVREHFENRVLLVFGCGGDRDRAKRPVMGRIAAEGTDLGWITNDNPRTEEPGAIAAEIAEGDAAGRLRIELDRNTAIGTAIAAARPGDVVLIAGKGHETTQTIDDRMMPFDDRLVARAHLVRRPS